MVTETLFALREMRGGETSGAEVDGHACRMGGAETRQEGLGGDFGVDLSC